MVREFPRITSNWRSDEEAARIFSPTQIPVVSELDTRALVRHLRTRGVMRGVFPPLESELRSWSKKPRQIPSMAGLDLASRVTTASATNGLKPSSLLALRSRAARAAPRFHVVAYDFGIKRNILRRLVHTGCRVTVVPALTSAEDVLALKPDGVFLSNGPGDPEPLETQVREYSQADRPSPDLRHLPRPPTHGSGAAAAKPTN